MGGDKPSFILNKVFEQQKALEANSGIQKSRVVEHWVKWHPPEADWIKVNTDGASKGAMGYASAGGLLRNSQGDWIGGFAANLGICSAFTLELWGVYYGLSMAWQKGYRKIIIEVDSKKVIEALEAKENTHNPQIWIILKCKELIGRD